MVKISLELAKLHPAFVSALPEDCDAAKVLEAVNQAIKDGGGESSGNIKAGKAKDGKVAISASGKFAGMKLADSPAGQSARINWYLFGSAEIYLRVDKVQLPISVAEWLTAKQFAKEAVAA